MHFFLAISITELNNFLHTPIIFEGYNLSIINTRELVSFECWTYSKLLRIISLLEHIKMHLGHGQKREPFEFVASMIMFLQYVYYAYASIIYKTNFRNIGEQNAYLFNFDLQKHVFIYIIIKVIIQPYPPQRLGEEGLVWSEITRYPFMSSLFC